jgi:DNA-directed RNA polymerase specialized sigma24 family protein
VSPTDDLDTLDGNDGGAPEEALVAAEEQAAEHARLRTVWSAYQQLPQRCRELLRVLFANPPLPYTEIADLLGIAVGSIGPTRGRCLRQVRELLGDAGVSVASTRQT